MDYGRMSAKIVVWRRSGGGPLQRGCLPWIITRLRSLEHAPEQIEEEDQLSGDGYDRRVGHKRVQANQRMQILELGQLRVAPGLARQPEIVHRHEDAIGADQRKEEMDSRHLLVHHSTKHLGEPIVSRRKDTENSGYTHDQMKMAGHEGGVVQRNIQRRLSQKRTAQSAGNKQRHKADGKQHWRLESNAALMKRPQPVKGLDGGGHSDRHGH